jgi:hypothetical protein
MAGRVSDVGRWVDTFQSAFPEATWVAIGQTRMPDDPDTWVALGLELELDDVGNAQACRKPPR